MSEVAYIYTGEITLEKDNLRGILFTDFDTFYKQIAELVSWKANCDIEALEIGKISGDPTKDYLKVNYKLHYTIATQNIVNAIHTWFGEKFPAPITSIKFKTGSDRDFCITIELLSEIGETESFEKKAVPSEVEEAVRKLIPEDLKPKVKFLITYPVVKNSLYVIE